MVGGGGGCPWPFVFFHDPATGMREGRTWFVVGLAMCWFWSRVHDSGARNDTGELAHIDNTEEEKPGIFAGSKWDDIENVLAFL